MSKKYRSPGSIALDVIIYIIMVFVLLVCLVPFIYMLALSLSDPKAIINNQVSFWPVGWNLDAYEQIFTYPNFFRAYGNTIFYTVAGTAIALFMMVLFAYPLSKTFLRGQKFFMKMVIVSMFFSGGLIPNYILMKNLNIYNTFWVMVLPGSINVMNLIVCRTFFQTTIPKELWEAASIDGCNDLVFFFKVVLPLSSTIIAVLALFYGSAKWNSYFDALIYLIDSKKMPLQMVLRNLLLIGQSTDMVGDAESMAERQRQAEQLKYCIIVVSAAPLLCLYPFLQKYFAKGVMIGSLKG